MRYTFDKKGYSDLLFDLMNTGAPAIPLKFHGDHEKKILLRHDVDNDPYASMKMAQLEHSLGIYSTYFILDTAAYWFMEDVGKIIKSLTALGHEVGWHNNAITNHLRTGKPLKACIADPLLYMKIFAKVTGTASHGDQLCHSRGYLNYYVFKETKHNLNFPNLHMELFNLSDFALEYEAYHVGHTHYISDSGGTWQQDNENVISDYNAKGGTLQVLVHPQWWKL